MSESSSTIALTHSLQGTFVSEKIKKIRWRPNTFNYSNVFVTGSYDNYRNTIKLWTFCDSADDEDVYPFNVATYDCCGDITEIQFVNQDYILSSSSSGSLHLFNVKSHLNSSGFGLTLENVQAWRDIHHFANGDSSPCTGFAVHENDVVTIGEDGRLNVLNVQLAQVVSTIDNADSCSLHCVTFLKHNEVLVSNIRGQMKIWDLRVAEKDNPSSGGIGKKPKSTIMLSGDIVTPTCLVYHPTQRHLVIAGDEMGSLTTWDLRNNVYPANVLSAHEGAITELKFHPSQPDHLFSCSTAGELWHWSTQTASNLGGKQLLNSYMVMGDEDNDSTTGSCSGNVWLAPDNVKNKVEVFTLMPTLSKAVNSLDLNRDRVLCGCDNEAVYLINGVAV